MMGVKVFSYIGLLFAVFLGSFAAEILYNKVAGLRNPAGEPLRQARHQASPVDHAGSTLQPGSAHHAPPGESMHADERPEHVSSSPAAPAPGMVRVSADKQQLIGVKVAAVTMAPQTQSFRTLDRVVPDENRMHRLVATVEGWVREIHGSTTGSLVQKNQVMATYFTIEFLNKQQQYFYALELAERQQKSEADRAGGISPESKKAPGQHFFQNAPYSKGAALEYVGILTNPVELSRVELLLMGVGETQLEKITRSREYASTIEQRSPVTGLVLSRNVSPDQRFHRGTELFVIGDLSRVWVLAFVHEREARHIRPGLAAKVSLPQQGTILDAVVSDVPPQYDAATRTYKVRMELDNPSFVLRPDMVVDVELLITHPPTITVPVDAVLDSGLKKTVFADMGGGLFEPINVETGWRSEDRVQITGGLLPGERIVVSGNFLLNSESRIHLAGAGGHDHHHGHHGPAMKAEPAALEMARDVACREDVPMGKAKDEGLTSDHEGKTYYFASLDCKMQFDRAPSQFVQRKTEGDPSASTQAERAGNGGRTGHGLSGHAGHGGT
jgi:membrane fusion protein, copper/silver efflux system